jgi:NADPH-dependent 2,4-dienoyl-CoA reductase/sulfur reductase-like enzyme
MAESARTAPLPFPNYTQIPAKVPGWVWHALRVASVATALAVAALLVVKPESGLALLWKVLVPSLPLVFLVVPGLWRNLCPMAALNQVPRLAGVTRGLAHTPRIREYSFVVGIALFFALVSSRKWLFDTNGAASAALVLFGLGGALLGGIIFKGKSGWCSSICPLLPVQRLYGQAPFAMLPNAHCRPCVGCTKNCYDFNPSLAYLADQYDDDRHYVGYRRLFAGALPGFIYAFYTVSTDASVSSIYAHFGLWCALSLALFQFLDTFLKVQRNRLTVVFGAAAIALYYWFVAPAMAAGIGDLTGLAVPPSAPWALRTVVAGIALVWVARCFRTERLFLEHVILKTAQQGARVGENAAQAMRRASTRQQAEVVIQPDDQRIAASAGQTLLEVIEGCGGEIEAGCRMGVCGADPIAVREGMENLSPAEADEKSTLERLGYAPSTRMACCAKVLRGSVTIALKPERRKSPEYPTSTQYDSSIKDVVIIGNGIAGITAADYARRRHPVCTIHVVAEENHPLYNRMAITRLIYGRSAMQGLYLLPDKWYDEREVTCWLNTTASALDTAAQTVTLATGDVLRYDRLILAMGSSSFVPEIEGHGGAGCFVVRSANDAMEIRRYAQATQARVAVIAGGGLLGLESAYALTKLGVQVTVLDRNPWLLHRQLDEAAAQLLRRYLEGLGISFMVATEIRRVARSDDGHLYVRLGSGIELPADLFIVAAGIVPNVALARACGIATRRGVVVDDHMRTSVPNVYAAGDVAEFEGRLPGLWPVAAEQGEVAAVNATSGNRAYREPVPFTILKVVGADVASVGRIEPAGDSDQVIVQEDAAEYRYRKLVVDRDGRLAGAILIGHPTLMSGVTGAVKAGRDVSGEIASLKVGDWSALETT